MAENLPPERRLTQAPGEAFSWDAESLERAGARSPGDRLAGGA